jgi:hypothetical protein
MSIFIVIVSSSAGALGGLALAQATRYPGEDQPGWEWFLGVVGAVLAAQLADLAWWEWMLRWGPL